MIMESIRNTNNQFHQSTTAKRITESETTQLKQDKNLTKKGIMDDASLSKLINKTELGEALEKVNDAVQMIQKGLKFQLHEDTERLMVKVVDVRTLEVIKEIPPKEILDMVAKIQKMVGLIIDEKI